MRVFLDTNVLLDLLMAAREYHEQATLIASLSEGRLIDAILTTQSIVDASYVFSQTQKKPLSGFRESVSTLFEIFMIVPIAAEDIQKANNSANPDYEDSVQVACALREGSDIIISSDKRLSKHTKIKVMTPAEFINDITV